MKGNIIKYIFGHILSQYIIYHQKNQLLKFVICFKKYLTSVFKSDILRRDKCIEGIILYSVRLRESAVGASPAQQFKVSLIPEQNGWIQSKLLRHAPLPWQKACWSLTEWPFYTNGNQGGTANLDFVPEIALLQSQGFFVFTVSNENIERDG